MASDDGIVGLTFQKCGDGKQNAYNNRQVYNQQMHISSIQKALNRGNATINISPASSLDLKGAFSIERGGINIDPGNSAASCINSETSSYSNNSTVATPREVIKRRSRTFKMAMPSAHRSAALIHKNFMQTFRNIGYKFY